jgi:hypothetical protein
MRKGRPGRVMVICSETWRRHSAAYASRNGIPLEVISKVMLRRQDLKTTQMYLGRISEMMPYAGWMFFTGNSENHVGASVALVATSRTAFDKKPANAANHQQQSN